MSSDAGDALELDAVNGQLLHDFSIAQPVFVAAFGPQSQRIFGTKSGIVHIWDESYHQIGTIQLPNYVKRAIRSEEKLLMVGAFGLLELDLHELSVTKQWNEMLVNTKENAVIVDGYVHICCYGYQMGSYRYDDGEMSYLIEDFRDFPKGMATFRADDGTPMLLVGGRGGYITAYRVENGIPKKIRTIYLQ